MKSVRKFQLGKAWLLPLLLVTALAFAGCAAPAAPAPAPAEEAAAPAEEAADPYVTVFGETLPEGAAPYEEQVLRWPRPDASSTTSILCRSLPALPHSTPQHFSDPQIRTPTSTWFHCAGLEVSEDGAVDLRLRPGQMWSDGTLTAADYEATWQAPSRNTPGTSPGSTAVGGRHQNWSKAVAGEVQLRDRRAVDDLTPRSNGRTSPLPMS